MGRVLTNNVSLAYAVEEELGEANGTKATGTLTLSGQPTNTQTVTIDAKVYTFQTTLTNVDGNVLIGATTADSLANLEAAVMLGPGAGTAYAAAMTSHPTVTADSTPTTLVVTAITGGTPGNSIATTETLTNGSWGGATLSGGVNPVWKLIEPNGINQLGAEITTVPRNPISRNRQRRKGTTTDLDSAIEFEADFTLDHFEDFAESLVFSDFIGAKVFDPSATDTNSYTVGNIGVTLAQNTLVYARGFTNSANNGMKVVNSGATTTDIPVTTALIAETNPANAVVEVAGVRGASGDLQINSAGNLISTTLNFTTLGLTPGQAIFVGGIASANRFTAAANFGFARIVSIAANLLTLDKKLTTFVTDAGTGKQIDILFGRFLRNVPVDHTDYLERSLMFEAAFPNLGAGAATEYEYSRGNFTNNLQFNLPLADKATITASFVGIDTDPATLTRKNGASTPGEPLKTSALNTSADIMRLRVTKVDESGLTTDFKSVTLTLNNNVTPEKVLARLGAAYMNVGNFEVDLESQIVFTDSDVSAAIRNNETVTLDFAIRNNDGAIFVDVPSVTLGGGGREFPLNESVLMNVTSQAFQDGTLGTSIGISLFPFVPTS